MELLYGLICHTLLTILTEKAVICSSSVLFAVEDCIAVAIWRVDTEDVSYVMMVEFWANICPCCV